MKMCIIWNFLLFWHFPLFTHSNNFYRSSPVSDIDGEIQDDTSPLCPQYFALTGDLGTLLFPKMCCILSSGIGSTLFLCRKYAWPLSDSPCFHPLVGFWVSFSFEVFPKKLSQTHPRLSKLFLLCYFVHLEGACNANLLLC